MKKNYCAIAALHLCFAAIMPGAMAAEKLTVGNANTVVRTVTGLFDADLRQIAMLDDLYHNELIETGDESATEIVFMDETNLSMGPNSTLVLDKFVYDPDPSQASFVVTATQGVFRFATGNLPKKSYQIHTPSATIGIRGTIFNLVLAPPGGGSQEPSLLFWLEEGEATLTGCSGKSVTLQGTDSMAMVTSENLDTCTIETRPLDDL
jgi:hypothetical protein